MSPKLSDGQPLLFAIYTRFSSQVQNEMSLESQELMCRRAVAERGGIVVQVYQDAATPGWNLDRPGLNQLRADAKKKRFNAVITWKFDRLARDHSQSVLIRTILRKEYGVKLFCVEGYSEDDDNSAYSSFVEENLAIVAALSSKALSTDVKRANVHRHVHGKFNGSIPPFGYNLATEKSPKRLSSFKATAECPPGLHVNPRAAALVRRAFKLYATGDYGYQDIARFLSEKSHLLKPAVSKPFGTQFVRELLQNKAYAGYVPYAETTYRGGFRQNKVSRRGRVEWSRGIHKAIISEELYDACQRIRTLHARKAAHPTKSYPHLLQKKVYCWHCLKQLRSDDEAYGRMVASSYRDVRYWMCIAQRRGYPKCTQKRIRMELVEQEVLSTLFRLSERLPEDLQAKVEEIVLSRAAAAADKKRIEELRQLAEKIDFEWEIGVMEKQVYAAKRRQLQYEIENAKPVEYTRLLNSAHILKDLPSLFAERDAEQRQELLDQLVERVIVEDKQVIAIILRGDIHLLIDNDNRANYGEKGTRTLTS